MKIKFKLTVAILGLLIMLIGILGGLSYFMAREELTTQIETLIKTTVELKAEDKNSLYRSVFNGIEAAAKTTSEYDRDDKEQLLKLYRTAMQSTGTKDVYLGYADNGEILDGAGWIAGADWDSRTRPWYQEPIKNNKTVVLPPYLDLSTNRTIISIATPVHKDGQIFGALSGDLYLDSLIEDVLKTQIGGFGYAFMLNSNGESVIHPNKDLINTSLSDALKDNGQVWSQIKSGEKKIIHYSFNGEDKMLYAAHIPTLDWYIAVTANQADIYAPLQKQLWTTGILALISLIIGLAVIWFLVHDFTTPLKKTVEIMERIGTGDITQRLEMKRKDEFGDMARSIDAHVDHLEEGVVAALQKISLGDLSFESEPASSEDVVGTALSQTINGLNDLITTVHRSGEQISIGSSQVADTSQELSQGATQQASALEEISSSMQQIGSQVQHNAGNAANASELANETKMAAEKGNASMESMMSAMQEINESGMNISKIIKVIDEIAFQTNLLALNAAVEAARAGQHGKGFAVVAEEVRNLAARSAKAAQETTELIEGSVRKADNGVQIATTTAEALREITDSATKVTDLVNEIAAASREQADGVTQISQGLGQIDQVTQQNTARAEEGAATAEELSSQSAELLSMLQRFKVREQKPSGTNYMLPPTL
jgi:methyl-accepting chemotaxis protein